MPSSLRLTPAGLPSSRAWSGSAPRRARPARALFRSARGLSPARRRSDLRARRRRLRWMLQRKRVCLFALGSSYDRKQPAPAHRPRPAPDHPGVLTFLDREEDDLRPAHEVLERYIADTAPRRLHTAVSRVVAIVAHHEIMA